MENLQSLINEHFPNASINDEIKKSTYDACSILLPNATPNTAKPLAVITSHDADFFIWHAHSSAGSLSRLPDDIPPLQFFCADHSNAKLKKELDFIAKHANKFSGCVTLSGWTTIARI